MGPWPLAHLWYSYEEFCAYLLLSQSQNHRIIMAGRNLWRPSDFLFCSKQGQLQHVAQGMSI